MKETHSVMVSLLEINNLEAAVRQIINDRKRSSSLIRISYAKDTLVGWRAIIAVGMAARGLVRTDQAFLRETCRKLFWSLSDESGGIGWSAPELLGEIVSADPRGFRDLVPLIANVYDREEATFRPGVVYALRRISESAPELVLEHQQVVLASLRDPDPLARVFGLQLLGFLWKPAHAEAAWSAEFLAGLRQTVDELRKDSEEAWVYEGEGFQSMLVSDVATELYNVID